MKTNETKNRWDTDNVDGILDEQRLMEFEFCHNVMQVIKHGWDVLLSPVDTIIFRGWLDYYQDGVIENFGKRVYNRAKKI
jgi:hypothetical protein